MRFGASLTPVSTLFSLPLFSLFLAAFAIGTTEFVVTGILPDVAGDLGVSIPTAGYIISGYAAGVAVGGPIIAILTANFERKATLLGLITLFIVGNALCALAPSYAWLMAARIVISFSHGAFFGIAVVAAANLVTADRRAAAISVVVGGITVANVLGVPLGTALGHAFGWRASFWAIVAIGAVAAVGMLFWLPRSGQEADDRPGVMREIRVLGRQEVWLSLLIIVAGASGFFAVFAFVAPMVVEVAGLPAWALPYLLSLLGIGALIGNIAGGRFADWKLMLSLVSIFVAMLVLNLVLLGAVFNLAAAAVVLFVWSAVNFSFAAPTQSRIIKGAADAPNLAATLVSTAFNIGISGGSALSALALEHGAGYAQLPWFGVAGAAVALALVGWAIRLDRRETVATRPAAA